MLVVVCLNPAIDVTYRVDSLVLGATHRVAEVCERAGGKGVNAAQVLRQLGEPVVLTGLAGAGWPDAHGFVPVAGPVRRTVTVVADDGAATVFTEPGPTVSVDEWAAFVEAFRSLVKDVVLLSGSLPPGVPADAYAQLTMAAHDAGARVLLDAEGEALRLALPARPDLVKPNADEARPYGPDPLAGLLGTGARNAVVSCGADGSIAALDGRRYRVRLGERVAGNPTGAGDALAAGLARGMAVGAPWPDVLHDATALAAAAVAVSYAGGFDPDVAARLRPLIDVAEG